MATFDKSRWPILSPILNELLDATVPERKARLAQIDAKDRGLAAELNALLAIKAQVETEEFLEHSPLERLSLQSAEGKVVGSYTLVREIGAGGMGTVWLADRSDGRYEGRAAVKLLNLALLGRAGLERFRREGNALARLSHPNIAHLVDAGAVDGQPFLVLEYIEGEPLDAWCNSRSLDVEARVRLFLQVLAAVSYAHSQLILHRDLKPSNILVTGQGQVKLLDFGIARLLDDDSSGVGPTEVTQLSGRALTPDYAAPEQVQALDASTATDVYALGVLLFQLLGGAHPTARKQMAQVERLRAVIENEPERLSDAALASDSATAQARSATLQSLARTLRGDLDNIVAKALKKVPAERYVTVDALAADLQRYLAHEPVTARGDSTTYRVGKFIRRNRLAVGAAGMVLLVLAMGVVGILWQATEAQRQRIHAVQQRDRAQTLLGRNRAISEFVGRMFTESLPPGQAAAVQEMLERGEAMVARDNQVPAADRAEMLLVLASYYNELENAPRAADLLQRARALIETSGDQSLKARLACSHASNLYLLNRREEGTKLLDEWSDAKGIDDESAALCLQTRSSIALNSAQAQEALRFATQGLERVRASPQPLPDLEAVLLGDIGFALHLLGRQDDALRHYATALERIRSLGRGESDSARRMMHNWANVTYGSGNFRQGLALFEELMRMEQAMNADQIANTPTLNNHAFGLEHLGRYEQALAEYVLATAASERNGEPVGKAYGFVGQASVLVQMGRIAEAKENLARAAKVIGPEVPSSHPVNVRARMVKGQIEAANGALDAASEHFTAIIESLRARGLSHVVVASAYRQRAEVALRQGDRSRARADAQQALELARRLQGGEAFSSYTGWASLTLGRIERDAGHNDAAMEAFRVAEENLRNTLGPDHPGTVSARTQVAALR